MRQGKNKNQIKEKVKGVLFILCFMLGMIMLGGESEDLSTIWVNILGAVILFVSVWLAGGFEKENR